MATIKKPSTLLKKAKKHLDTKYEEYENGMLLGGRRDTNPYICNAVKLAAGGCAGGYDAPPGAALTVINHIENLLGREDTLQSWLGEVHGIVAHHDTKADFEKLQLTRLAWIDDMIVYWKAKGK